MGDVAEYGSRQPDLLLLSNHDDPVEAVYFKFREARIAGERPDPEAYLHPDSPCIDKGTDEGAPAVDLDGDKRPQGEAVDIGADEASG